jgi:hypothetical protein
VSNQRETLTDIVCCYRECGCINESWNDYKVQVGCDSGLVDFRHKIIKRTLYVYKTKFHGPQVIFK